jgi:hypothetical protein
MSQLAHGDRSVSPEPPASPPARPNAAALCQKAARTTSAASSATPTRFASGNSLAVQWDGIVSKVLIPTMAAPLIGFTMGIVLMVGLPPG